VHRGHQEIAGSTGSVTREYPACSVRTVSGRSKPKNQNARAGVAKTGNRFGPIGFFTKCRTLHTCDLSAVRAQAAALLAGDDILMNSFQRHDRSEQEPELERGTYAFFGL